MYYSTKTYGHDVGLSTAFRQWRANSHCAFLHGYALEIKMTFQANALDERNWVVDFGGLGEVKKMIKDQFDHKTLVASDDPDMHIFQEAARLNVMDLVVVDETGCEAFSKQIYKIVLDWLETNGYWPRVSLYSVEVREHGANSAIYTSPRK